MQNDETNESNAVGKEVDTDVAKPQTTSIIDSAKEQADRLEAANKKQEELINRQEDLYARQQLGGNSEAGQAPEKPKEETDEEFTERFESGQVDLTK